jgi:hypothetical protein
MDKLIDLINDVIKNCEPIEYKDWNRKWKFKDGTDLSKFDIIVNKDDEVSTLSLISTITELLCGKHLAFSVDEHGIIDGVKWYEDLISDGGMLNTGETE